MKIVVLTQEWESSPRVRVRAAEPPRRAGPADLVGRVQIVGDPGSSPKLLRDCVPTPGYGSQPIQGGFACMSITRANEIGVRRVRAIRGRSVETCGSAVETSASSGEIDAPGSEPVGLVPSAQANRLGLVAPTSRGTVGAVHRGRAERAFARYTSGGETLCQRVVFLGSPSGVRPAPWGARLNSASARRRG